jgi:cytochrome c oxidase cbb3-type subunit 3
MTASDNTTGHVWDGDLREMNNPLPRWWAWLFVITIVFAFVYLALYPGLGTYGGKLGWTSTGQHMAEVEKGNAEVAPLYAKFTAMKPEDVAKDPQAQAIGERLFMNNCAQCHGSDARGNKGFPNLADNDWLGGGTPEIIKANIVNGRNGMMPPMAAAVGTADDVKNVAQYVLSLSNSPHDSVQAALGKSKFGSCAACHGADGKGNHALGAPNLTDDIWLHGYGEAAIVAMVNNGKTNVMPPQADKLTEAQVHVLASYVWSLSNKGAVAAK